MAGPEIGDASGWPDGHGPLGALRRAANQQLGRRGMNLKKTLERYKCVVLLETENPDLVSNPKSLADISVFPRDVKIEYTWTRDPRDPDDEWYARWSAKLWGKCPPGSRQQTGTVDFDSEKQAPDWLRQAAAENAPAAWKAAREMR
ncbi:hypothetical protein ABZW18_31595 [Streptomyces sp. NPDC004647]|uniref:hypothetical protein n=1 Tax=Streptomyces sp. NPDC004647 TaxID=3154671 RepID=UPI0033AA6F4C